MAKRTASKRRRNKLDPVKFSRSPRLAPGRAVVWLILCALLLAGIASRVHFLDRSLWLDEAWVANSMQAASLGGAFYYDEWLQTSPPLFIALGRLFINLFGASNVALRALPAVSGIIAVFLLAFLAFRLLRPSFALVAILLFVFCPRAILYSQSVKQYSTDIFATISLLALGHVYLEKRSDRWFYGLLAGVMLLSFLSYPAMFFFPFVLLCALTTRDSTPPINPTQTGIRLSWLRGGSAIAAAVLVCLTNYFVFILPNQTSALTEFFQDGFYRGSNSAGFLTFYWDKFATLTEMFFFGGPGPLRIGSLLITVFGFLCLWAPLKNLSNVTFPNTPVLLTAPAAAVVGLNMLGLFPLPGFQHRVLLFLFPVTLLVFCLGLQTLASVSFRFLGRRFSRLNATSIESAFGAVVLLGMSGLVWLFFNTVGLMPFFAEEHEDSEEAVAFLRQRVEADDVLFVHPTMREQFKLYTRAHPIPAQRIIYGKVGMPCCPRGDYRDPQQESEKDVTDEINALSGTANGRRLWVLMTNRGLHWFHLQRNDIEIFERSLAGNHCPKLGEEKFTGVYVAGFGCQQR